MWNPVKSVVNKVKDAFSYAKDAFEGITGQKQYELGKETNAQNLELANTQIQRRKADLIAAGMNPALAADGSGAPVTMSTPEAPNPIGGALNAAQAILGIKSLKAQLLGQQKENRLKDQQSAMNAQSMLSIAEDIKSKRADLDEKLYNLNKYKEFGFPTNAGEIPKGIMAIKGLLDSPALEKLKHTPEGKKVIEFFEAMADGKGYTPEFFPKMSAEDLAKRHLEELDVINARSSLKARKQALKNREELIKYKTYLQSERGKRKETLRRYRNAGLPPSAIPY